MVRYSGLSVWIAGGFSNVEGFEKKKNYMKSVDEGFILDAINVFRKEPVEKSDVVSEANS